MQTNNPYEAPKGNIQRDSEEFSQVSIFAIKGRLGRLRYVAYAFGLMFVAQLLVVLAASALVNTTSFGSASNLLIYGIYVPVAVLGIMLGIQRCHDLNITGWLILVSLIPIVNIFFILYLIFAPGTDGSNRFGAPPPPNTLGVKILASILPIIFILGIVAAIAIPMYMNYVNRVQ